jgi:hypothetical protein
VAAMSEQETALSTLKGMLQGVLKDRAAPGFAQGRWVIRTDRPEAANDELPLAHENPPKLDPPSAKNRANSAENVTFLAVWCQKPKTARIRHTPRGYWGSGRFHGIAAGDKTLTPPQKAEIPFVDVSAA